ncbi:4-alpha-glucanotransferase [Pigmentiphaga sp. NML080357]|uniref:4-alpha-glucanotransferase n=1 Tax=Pigmentiphaga sp. NML080357 TaxID=2008675 RepID=UPI000B40E767|nr:4-alpha-glucanotransferase [Pigmentiphaga sp. NML080357]OVZ55864.1 4-alpha-glucanotransferase [Pigmentiphaga sp. NML080357]
MSSPDHDLERLAGAAGIAVHWKDAMGRHHAVAPDVLRTMLTEFGLEADTPAQISASLAFLTGPGNEETPALKTALQGEAIELPWPGAEPEMPFRLVFEDGAGCDGVARRGHAGVLTLPGIARPGYHTLLIGGATCTVAVAPRRCFAAGDALHREHGRIWALGAQLYSLRREAAAAGAGFGDFTALQRLAEQAAAQGAAAVAVSPMHAMFSADPTRYSPYAPSSRLFLNVLYVDPAAVFGAHALAAVTAKGLGDELARLADLDLVDWPAAGRAKLAILHALFDDFPRNVDARAYEDFLAFEREGGPSLQAHARFEAVHAWRVAETGDRAGWRHWPAAFRSPDSPDVERFARHHEREVRFHLFLQWLAARGLAGAQSAARAAGMPIGLISDLAVGTDPSGSHAWTRQEEVLSRLSPGAPPDVFNPKGQAWGLTAFSPRALRARGYRAFIELLRASLAHAGGVRIDHALGLSRMWLVPEGASPAEGAYVSYPFEDMMRLIALESWRYRAIVVGENLGTVPEGFNAQIEEAGMLGMDVLWFTREGDWPGAPFRLPADWSSHALATTTTHDLPTVAGWWRGTDIHWRERLGLLAEGSSGDSQMAERTLDRSRLWQDLHRAGLVGAEEPVPEQAPVAAVLGFVAATPAPLLLVPLEDMLALEDQPNLPGTIDAHPNWRRRMPVSVESMFAQPEVAERVAALTRARGAA